MNYLHVERIKGNEPVFSVYDDNFRSVYVVDLAGLKASERVYLAAENFLIDHYYEEHPFWINILFELDGAYLVEWENLKNYSLHEFLAEGREFWKPREEGSDA